MKITVKDAYNIALDILDGFHIYSCTELNDGWVFAFKNDNGSGICIPPLKISLDGKASLHDETAATYFKNECREKGKIIPLDEIEKMK